MNTDETEEIREVFANFGLAIYQAQCLERQIAILLATEYGPGIKNITRPEYEAMLDTLFSKTLGNLVRQLQIKSELPEDFETQLREALGRRNWLAHNYFWERAGHFMTYEGRKMMIHELESAAQTFDMLDSELTKISQNWRREVGIPDEFINFELERIIEAASKEAQTKSHD